MMAANSHEWLTDWGFDLEAPGDAWMESLRAAEAPFTLGCIGEYVLEREVGRGGQGVVFRAYQPGAERHIALKRLLGGSFASAAGRHRFEREAEAAAALDHPNIVTVLGMEVGDDEPALAMEWIDGVPVTDWARRRSPEVKLELFLRIADAVQHAHSRGVLHRDLKPSNILVDADGQPHVLDFGLAKCGPLEAASADPDVVSGNGAVPCQSKSATAFGTAAYAAPEQLDGRVQRIDARADVYALGVILFELMTGESPYGRWEGVPDLMRRIGTTRPPKPSTLDPRVGADLDRVVHHALEPDREQRYRSAADLAGDVRRYLGGESIHAPSPSSWRVLCGLVARNRLATAFLAASFLGAIAFAVQREVLLAEVTEQREEARRREARLAALLAFVPDCVHCTDRLPSTFLAKPGTVLDESLRFSSPNPHYVPPRSADSGAASDVEDE